MPIILSHIDKNTNKRTVSNLDVSHFSSSDPTCFGCTKDISEHTKKNISKFKTNKNYHSFKLLIENDEFQTIYATKGKDSLICIFAEECLSSLSKYRVGAIIKFSEKGKEMSFMTEKPDDEYEKARNYPNSCFAIEHMISRNMIIRE